MKQSWKQMKRLIIVLKWMKFKLYKVDKGLITVLETDENIIQVLRDVPEKKFL